MRSTTHLLAALLVPVMLGAVACDGGTEPPDETCGNGVIDTGETCDPAITTGEGFCPAEADCDDGDASTIDNLQGSAEACTASCSNTPITACTPGDGFCPTGCTSANDSDCAAVCGNGVVEGDELCDGNCDTPSDCNDGSACTADSLTGSAATCDAVCVNETITQCRGGDSCCPEACNANNDSDCNPRCGNDVPESGELCDGNCPVEADCDDTNACTADALLGAEATCDARCESTLITACVPGDGCCPGSCTSANDSDCTAVCGNNIVEAGETCDGANCPTGCNDGNACTVDTLTGAANTCDALCANTPVNTCTGGDGCCPAGCTSNSDSDCSASCGNGTIEAGETCDGNCPATCDDSNACTENVLLGSADTCSAQCTYPRINVCANDDGCCPAGCNNATDNDCSVTCGNGIEEEGETCDPPSSCPTSCDDSNACTVDTMTGSSATCNVSCAYQNVTICVDGDGCCPSGCTGDTDSDCASTTCGNGTLDAGESCDSAIAAGQPGACPSTCDDSNACTIDGSTGSAATCNLICTHQNKTTCTDGDGCCPAGCTSANDNDCQVPGAIGSSCTLDSGCTVAAAGETAWCITEAATEMPGGYCTQSCVVDPTTPDNNIACPADTHCAFVDPDYGYAGVCVPNCGTNSDCRLPNYECYDADDAGVSECWGVATGAGDTGDVCDTRYDCSGGQMGFCLSEAQYGWTDGYCTRQCDTLSPCPTGSHCALKDDQGSGLCLSDCAASGDCRGGVGYLCEDVETPADGVTECYPGATGTGAVGDACTGTADCGGGLDGFCYDSVDFYNGYCSESCNINTDPCPTGSHCIATDQTTGDGVCLKDCTSSANCRSTGYACYDVGDGGGNECWISATGTGAVGAACTAIYDCAGGQYGFCLTEAESGLPGGYCSIECSAGTGTCTGDSNCYADFGICLDGCTGTDCRTPYACYDIGLGGGVGACWYQE